MKSNRHITSVLLPLLIAIGITGGIFIGISISSNKLTEQEQKLLTVLGMIKQEYVDEVDVDSILEKTFPDLLAQLDPHSAYIAASELTSVNEDLTSSFSGVGISFQILNDTVVVVEVIPEGPAEKVGIMPGDRIISANGKKLAGEDITSEDVFNALRGKKDTKAVLQVNRKSSRKQLTFDVIRGDIPVKSVDGVYMISDGIGYLRVSKFANNTYNEFFTALTDLKAEGAKKFVIDLRGNSGGFMEQAIYMANEFLPKDRMIVYSKGRNPINETVAVSDGNGSFQNSEIVVLTDEYSASASEIFAGAIQDNDRGLIIGRRSFGKGLVQNQTVLPDSSAIRLTVARYYTPSGRCIQKEYTRGHDGKYSLDIVDRFNRGEFYSSDSIKLDKKKTFLTTTGRKVYGGGGIMPDLFVPQDTTGITNYYINVFNQGIIQKFAFEVADKYRSVMKGVRTVDQLMKVLPRDETLLNNFVGFAVRNGVPARWYYINLSKALLLNQIKAVIARDILGYDAYLQALNLEDLTVIRAVGELKAGHSPVIIRKQIIKTNGKTGNKKKNQVS